MTYQHRNQSQQAVLVSPQAWLHKGKVQQVIKNSYEKVKWMDIVMQRSVAEGYYDAEYTQVVTKHRDQNAQVYIQKFGFF